MCLYCKEDFEPCKVGYKVVHKFHCRKKKITLSMQGDKIKPLLRGVWLNEKDYRNPLAAKNAKYIKITRSIKYPLGFHVFHSAAEANIYCIGKEIVVKVAVREPVATGTQNGGCKVTVAKQIKILPDIDRRR